MPDLAVARTSLPPLVVAVSLGLGLAACGPAYKVAMRSGPPSALRTVASTQVQFDYRRMQVEGRPEDVWVDDKTADDPEYPTTWANLKGRFEQTFMEGFRRDGGRIERAEYGTGPGEGEAVLVVQVTDLRIGTWIPFTRSQTYVAADMDFWVEGAVTDQITMDGAVNGTITNPSVFQHIGPIGVRIGGAAGSFLNDCREN